MIYNPISIFKSNLHTRSRSGLIFLPPTRSYQSIDKLTMSSFTSYIPGSDASTNRLNPGRKRPAPSSPRINDFELAQRAQRNEMFFTDADDQDSTFGSDDPAVVEESTERERQSRPQNQSPRTQGIQNGRTPNNGSNNIGRSNVNSRTNIVNNRNSPRRLVSLTTRTPAIPLSSVPETIQIKDEDAEIETTMDADFLRNIPSNQRVKIFVGRKNRSIQVHRADLSKSPTLQSYIVDDPVQGSFIMRPQLMTTHYEDFAAVAQFLRNGEYAPLLSTLR